MGPSETMNYDAIVVGCGLTGAVIARELAEKGKRVVVFECRDHIGGNMYDYVDEHGYLVQKYGPHTFHTMERELLEYISRFEQWQRFDPSSGAVWDGKFTPTPFNFRTIDTFYPADKAAVLKEKLKKAFAGRDTATVLEVLKHPDPDIRGYAEYLYENDYAPYTAKQWGISPDEIDRSVLERLPLRFSYAENCFDDTYQVLPSHSYTQFFVNLLDHQNITVRLKTDALEHIAVTDGHMTYDGEILSVPVVYTGPLDELFRGIYGRLPYRSLRFEWRYSEEDSFQPAVLVAYPQEKEFTRIVEYKKLPVQEGRGSSYCVEYPVPCDMEKKQEPYYPILTAASKAQYEKYIQLAETVDVLVACGRLADFKYYNMDQALKRALEISKSEKLNSLLEKEV